jgi:hypothetical protein
LTYFKLELDTTGSGTDTFYYRKVFLFVRAGVSDVARQDSGLGELYNYILFSSSMANSQGPKIWVHVVPPDIGLQERPPSRHIHVTLVGYELVPLECWPSIYPDHARCSHHNVFLCGIAV